MVVNDWGSVISRLSSDKGRQGDEGREILRQGAEYNP